MAEPTAEEAIVDALVERARAAQRRFERNATQERYDAAALAAGWALMEPTRNRELSELAVETTGLGNVPDKITKNHRKTLGLLRDIKGAVTCGIVRDDPESGITEVARAVGVVGAVVPSTNPVATPTNNVINALKCGNAIILSPSPKGVAACERLLGCMHAEFAKLGIDRDLVQMIPAPVSKAKAQRLMERVDRLIVTGSQDNVRRAYSSGTPAIGVGAGNVTVIVDETADLKDAAAKITVSKAFDNATSCSSENAVVVLDAVHDAFMTELHAAGGRLLTGDAGAKLKQALFAGGHLNRAMLAKDIDRVIAVADVPVEDADTARFLLIEGEGIGRDYPESGEKLSLVATLYRARDFHHARQLTHELFRNVGAGHSVGIHTSDAERPLVLARTLPTCRVIVNQAHCFATGGSFDNGAPFSLSMGCGSWGGNSIDENFSHKHLVNITRIVRTIAPNEPALDDIFGPHWEKAGK
ncbi:aldehyde dehydrogenase family protein [Nitratireductor sp. XY-223]|uniref:acylating sulfoacetaldehyde dehydrogenase n=1 Tax=Nitratireductor sp. XY-223 TaxID=2561926 RepID=UPI001FEF9476|nr:aldehyde dehydrogenase family protein [Nitratireductor sp. XY-223]